MHLDEFYRIGPLLFRSLFIQLQFQLFQQVIILTGLLAIIFKSLYLTILLLYLIEYSFLHFLFAVE